MPPLPKNNVNLYNSLQDIETSVPYVIEDANELEFIVLRFVTMSRMLITHPDTAAMFGDLSTTCIQLATDLRTALKVSRQERLYPSVVIPMNKYFTAKMIYVQSQSIEPELPDFLQQEIQKWEEPSLL
jgi:hypothetical protein